MTETVPARSDVPANRTWDVLSVFPNDEAWESAIGEFERQLPVVAAYSGRLSESGAVLADFFEAQERLFRVLGSVFVYASGIHAVDTLDPEGVAKVGRARGLWGQAAATVAFGEPEVIALGADNVDRMVAGEPRLQVYAHFFDNLFREQAHVRSVEVEEVLGLVQEPFMTATSIHSVLTDTDLTFRPAVGSGGQEVEVAHGNYDVLRNDADRELRRTAYESFTDAHLAFRNTMAMSLAAGIQRDVFRARTRRYSSSLEAALAPSNIPVEVFHTLIDTFKSNLPTWHRYWRVRREALGYEELHPYDIWAPLGGQSPRVTYEESVRLICEGMEPLGNDYVNVLRNGCLQDRWVDVYPNRGKTSGAYSDGFPGTFPFILMSYTDDVFSLSTLAHELGHSLHSYYSWKHQPLVYTDYSMFVAETASNFNQALVRHHLLKTQNDLEFQLALLEETMNNFHRYFFIMPTLARLELEIHEKVERGEPLTAEGLSQRTAELFSEGYGGEMKMDSERVGITWAEFSHHMYGNFYVFQYATGISAANALARGVLEEGRPAAERYLEFLKAGDSLYPIEALKLAGVDMTSPQPVDRAFQALAETVDQLETIVGDRTRATA